MYQVNIDHFEGPLDLLLHLIKEKEMDIFDIKIAEITDQYLMYIKNMKQLHLDVASEYLVMASYLLEIKSKSLLPTERVEVDAEYEEDPREMLIKRLIEYKRYKDVVDVFKEYEKDRHHVFTKTPENLSHFVQEEMNQIAPGFDVNHLMAAMEEIAARKQKLIPEVVTLTKKEYSVEDRVNEIEGILHYYKGQRIPLDYLIEAGERQYVIVTFLAILALAKTQRIEIIQLNPLDKIEIDVKE